MSRFVVNAGNYPIYISSNLEEEWKNWVSAFSFNPSKVALVMDSNVATYCYPKLKAMHAYFGTLPTLILPPDDLNKNLFYLEKCWHFFHEHQLDRRSCVIAFGGGMVGDLCGFAAATYHRGIAMVQIPTTLLAMVDASVGGKTAINYNQVKNLIGVFRKPEAVFIDPIWLHTLPVRELYAGYAEVIKHALITGGGSYKRLLATVPPLANNLYQVICDSVKIKRDIVVADFKERKYRKVLNFGHTIGHAIESTSLIYDETPLKHGEAIAMGMIAELYLSHKLCGFPLETFEQLNEYIQLFFSNKFNYDIKNVAHFVHLDKKNFNNQNNFVLLSNIGKPEIDVAVSDELIYESLDQLQKI